MSEPIILHRKLLGRIITPIICLIIFAVYFGFILNILGIFGGSLAPLRSFFSVLSIINLVLMLFVIAIFVYITLVTLTDTIVFDENQLTRRGIPQLSQFYGSIGYDQIARIQRGMYGTLHIIPIEGKVIRLSPRIYEGGQDRFIMALRSFVPQEKIDPDLSARTLRYTIPERLLLIALNLAPLLFLASLFTDDLVDLIRKDADWTTAVKSHLWERIEDFEIDQEDRIYLLMRRVTADWEAFENYSVHILHGDEKQVIPIPDKNTLGVQDPEDDPISPPDKIYILKDGAILLNFFLDPGALLWDGSQWEWFPEGSPRKNGPSYTDLIERYIQWLSETDAILINDVASGQAAAYDLTQSDIPMIHEANRNQFGWTNLLIEIDRNQYAVTSILGEDSPDDWYALPLLETESGSLYRSFLSSDPQGNPIIFLDEEEICTNGTYIQTAGRLDLARQAWVWRDLAFPNDCEHTRQEKPLIDQHGRIWIEGHDQVAIFPPEVFSEPDPQSAPSLIYSEANSGYISPHRLQLKEDGRIWALEILGDKLIWIDSTQKNLPAPMQPWLAKLAGNSEPRLVPYFAILFILLIPAIVMQRKEQRVVKEIQQRYQG